MAIRNMRAVAAALLLGTAALAGASVLTSVPAAAAVRAAVGKPLNEAISLYQQKNYKAAMAKVEEAEAVGNKTSEESQAIAQMKNAIAVASGDKSTAAGAKAAFANDFAAKKYKDVIEDGDALKKNGVLDGQSQQVIAQAYYLSGDKAGCIKYIKANFGANPGDTTLALLARCAYDQGDEETQRGALETLVAHTGKSDYWNGLLKLSEHAQGMRDHDTLDIYRLKLLTGTLTEKDDYIQLAQLALQLGSPTEAQNALAKGVAAKAVPADHKLIAFAKQKVAEDDAGMAKRLAAANAAPQGDDLVKIGEDQTGQGKGKDAIATIQAGMKKNLADKNNATMRLGQAYLNAGQKADAVKTFDSIKGPAGDKGAMIAHLWSLYARH